MTDPVSWDPTVPPGLRRVLLDLVESADPEEGGPLGVLARLLNVATPSEWGNDAVLWVRSEIEHLDSKRVYQFVQDLAQGRSHYDKRVNEALGWRQY